MKTYIKPSFEVKKFDVEDIIQTSGTVVNYEALSEEGKALYDAYTGQEGTTEGNYLEFWL